MAHSDALQKVSYLRLKSKLKKFLFLNVYLLLRDRKRESTQSEVRPEREGDTESKAGSRLQAVSTEPDSGLNS